MNRLIEFLDDATRQAVPPAVSAFADALAAAHPGTEAVLAYGSALRDSTPDDTLIDYYILVDAPEHLTGNGLLRFLGRLVPPNVHYAERVIAGQTVRCKFAVMTLLQFKELCGAKTSNPYVWARFAQPCRLVWVRDTSARSQVVQALADAARTALGHGLFLSRTLPWQALFEHTYRTEWRPESKARAALIVASDAAHYRDLSRLLDDVMPHESSWAAKRFFGKLWSTARLLKAAFSFEGGADYAAWKIARHSGVKIEVTDWQRRHPLLAGMMLLPKLLRSRGLR